MINGRIRELEQRLFEIENGSTCDGCKRKEYIDFLVSNRSWNLVMAGEEGVVLCLDCFDRRARDCGIEYLNEVVVLGTDCWMGANWEGGIPANIERLLEEAK